MRRMISGAVLLALVATATVTLAAQEEPMYVSLTYVSVKPGMNQAFMAAAADHLAWRKSINDAHYYSVSRVQTGPRSGQIVFAAGPMPGAQMDDYNAFGEQSMADWAGRGAFGYVDSVETVVMQTMPQIGNPPPPGTMTPMVHVYELELDYGSIPSFMEALGEMDAVQKSVGNDGYAAWTMPVSGTSFNKRWFINWVDGWADTAGDPQREARVMEAAGGQDAYEALMGRLMGAVTGSSVTTYVSIPDLSHLPAGQ